MTKVLRKQYFKVLFTSLAIAALAAVNTEGVYARALYAKPETIITNGIVKCYPNPANTYIVFSIEGQLRNEKHKLVIYSFTGRKMQELNITSGELRVDLSTYFRGVYLYQLVNSSGKALESGKFQVVK